MADAFDTKNAGVMATQQETKGFFEIDMKDASKGAGIALGILGAIFAARYYWKKYQHEKKIAKKHDEKKPAASKPSGPAV